MAENGIDLNRTYDAVVVGSGAAGGMAAHVLTTHGLKVLMLEAGKKLPIEKELRSMQWPYDNPYRGELPPDRHSLSFNEYTIRKPPYGPGFEESKHLHSYIGDTDYVKNIVSSGSYQFQSYQDGKQAVLVRNTCDETELLTSLGRITKALSRFVPIPRRH